MNIQANLNLSIAALSIDSLEGRIVSDVSLAIARGRPLTLLGESGSGKSLVAQAIMGNLPPGLRTTGRVIFKGTDLFAETPAQRRRHWGRSICLLPQEPWLALDPTMRVLPQVAEIHRFVKDKDATRSDALAKENLAGVSLASTEALYPFQMSGGMGQRAAIAMAHAADSELLIADEPTKGLDTALRDSVTARLKQEAEAGRLLLTITHDVAVARALGGMIGVMLDGRLVEYAPAEKLLQAPEHAYTKALLASEPASWGRRASSAFGEVILAGRGLAKRYANRILFSDLDIAVAAGDIVSIFGPSGCGKTTVGNILLGLTPPDAGVVERKAGVSPLRFQKLYQDPPAAFASHQTIRKGLTDLVRLHAKEWTAVKGLLDRLRLPEILLDRLPGHLSGGELQRFALLRALLLNPAFLFADEATSRLDPVSQKEVISFLQEIVRETGLAVLLVTHDRDIAEKLSARVINLENKGPHETAPKCQH
ncbi:putative ATPase component of various ABC-type transport system (plasmid) [Sinorhizobium fredii NGR234]|uniref:ATPase component of various ABC-type transport system n=1 Tax=Sinorhizobium fredii (strain NBRC 101917 / NGR234) TaxID=394 RepID=Q6W139_SINFN|nr:ATP-binding cassette domain-containing protein [Sinorhizobium fredii]AAQ87529.1 Transporter (fr Peptide) [Sinorhizobium fredii NGR234]ACP22064.1 putative ATPase component of various ABC-type transport system [Sinorhizobium fredii NGR234]